MDHRRAPKQLMFIALYQGFRLTRIRGLVGNMWPDFQRRHPAGQRPNCPLNRKRATLTGIQILHRAALSGDRSAPSARCTLQLTLSWRDGLARPGVGGDEQGEQREDDDEFDHSGVSLRN